MIEIVISHSSTLINDFFDGEFSFFHGFLKIEMYIIGFF
jgi:hypothetical protein